MNYACKSCGNEDRDAANQLTCDCWLDEEEDDGLQPLEMQIRRTLLNYGVLTDPTASRVAPWQNLTGGVLLATARFVETHDAENFCRRLVAHPELQHGLMGAIRAGVTPLEALMMILDWDV